MCLAGVHSPASSVDLFSTGAFLSTRVFSPGVDSPSALFMDSRRSEIVSINLNASRSRGRPNIRMVKISNKRNEPAVSISMRGGRLLLKEAEGFKQPLRLKFWSKLADQYPSMTACATLTSAIKLITAKIFINRESHSLIISSCGESLVHNPITGKGVKPRPYDQ